MNKNLIWYGPPYSYSGYATHNRCMLFELHKLNWNIRLIPTESYIPTELIGATLLQKFVNNKNINPQESICINLIPPPTLPYWGKYTILFTTLESETVHEGYMRRCLQFDEVWVPCKSNLLSMKKAGYPKHKLHYCPEGVYSQFWKPTTHKLKQYESSDFTFFYNGDWSYRKGIDILIPAFAKAFSPTDNVRLLLLTHYQGHGKETSLQHIGTEFQEICQKHNITRTPRIQFIYEHIPDPLMPKLFNCADIGVFPTRGEAWGLPIIQLMSCGKPVITTNWGGQLDYCNKHNSYLIDIEKFDILDDKVHLTVDFYKQQKFAFPSENHLISLMKYCYNHPDLVKARGQKARQDMERNFQWKESGQIANKRLMYLLMKKNNNQSVWTSDQATYEDQASYV